MNHRRSITWGALALIVFAVIGMMAFARRTSLTATDSKIPVAQVQRGDLDLKVFATGELRASHSMVLTAPAIGGGALQITRLLHTGTPVKKGDIVFEFDPSEQNYKLEQNRSELMQAEEEITKAMADAEVQAAQDKVALLKARFDVRRAELDVQKNELVSAIESRKNELALEQAKGVLAKLEQDLKSHTASGHATILLAREKRNKAKLAMDLARTNIDNMRVPAPMEGLVAIERNSDAMGGMGWPGMSVPDFRAGDQVQPGTAIAQVIDAREMELTAKIGERDRGNVKIGQSAEVTFDALPGQIFRATVKTVGDMSQREFFAWDTGGKFDVSIQLPNPDSRLRPGLTARIVILGDQRKDVLSVPRQGLFMRDGKRVAYVEDGKDFQPREIKIQNESESRAVIEGLNAGAKVALVDPTAPRKEDHPGSAAQDAGGGAH